MLKTRTFSCFRVVCAHFALKFQIFFPGRTALTMRLGNLEAAVVVFLQCLILLLFVVLALFPLLQGGVVWIANRFYQLLFPFFGGLDAAALDVPAAAFLCVVFLVAQGSQLYSLSYLCGEVGLLRFVSIMFLFTSSMSMLVCADSFFIFFVAWEAVGWCSFLLIGFWTSRQNASVAALKAVSVNRVTDMLLFLGLACLQQQASSASFGQLPGWTTHGCSVPVASFLLIFAACGKSAQVGFHAWLLTAMEGPTPVSALMHAATLVTAGVILLVKALGVIIPHLWLVLLLGALTAGFCGFAACFETDFKAIVAYSTSSQLGFMFMLVAAARVEAVFGHLVNHAVFKALLFWAAGVFTHVYGGQYWYSRSVARLAPLILGSLLVGSVSLWGLPFTAGFYTKEYLVFLPLGRPEILWLLLVMAVLLVQCCSVIYTARLLAVVAFGPFIAQTVTGSTYSSDSVDVPLPIRAVLVLASCWTIIVGRATSVETLSLFQDTVFVAELSSAFVDLGGTFSWVGRSSLILQLLILFFISIFAVSFARVEARCSVYFRRCWVGVWRDVQSWLREEGLLDYRYSWRRRR